MRMRTIHTGFWANEELAQLPAEGRLLFIGLWMLADREGRLKDRPHWIGTQIFPYAPVEVGALLDDLVARGFLVRYEAESGKYLEIQNFAKYQKPHPNESGSKIPPSPKASANGRNGFNQREKPGTPLVETASTNARNGFPSVSSVYSESLSVGVSESLTDARTAQAPVAPDEAPPLPSPDRTHCPNPNPVFRELARLQADAEEHWPKRAAIEQGMDEIRVYVTGRASPTETLLEVRRGFEIWVRAIPPEGLTPDALDDWPNLETWARKRLWRDPPRRIGKGRAGPQPVARDREAMVREGMAMAMAKRKGA